MTSQSESSDSLDDDYKTLSSDDFLGVERPVQRPPHDDIVEDPPPRRTPPTPVQIPSHVMMRIPNTAFGIAMGLAGNAILWKSIGTYSTFLPQGPQVLNGVLWLLALLVAMAVAICYCYKALFHFDLVLQEIKHPVRVHFMNTPHLVLLMLTIGLPEPFGARQTSLQVVFGIALVAQTLITQHIYDNWLFNPMSSIACSKPPFLLSTVGWFLLANLGLQANIEESWGLALPQFCLGVGGMFYVMVTLSIMNSLHHNRATLRGSPSLMLLVAPPSVGVVALDVLDDSNTFSNGAAMVLGWILVMFLLFAKMGPKIAANPGVLGEYWAYVFPLSAVATAFVRYARAVDTTAAAIVAVGFMSVAIVALLAVVARMFFHIYLCTVGQAQWGDPLLGITSSSIPQSSTRPASSSPAWNVI